MAVSPEFRTDRIDGAKAFDCHTHRLDAEHACINLPMEALVAGEVPCARAGVLYSAGILPLYLGDWDVALNRVQHLAETSQIQAIGECGLDKRSPVPMEKQTDYFQRQIALACRHDLPLIIHCVRAWGELLAAMRQTPRPSLAIVHGFRGKPELMRQLLDAGLDISFGERYNPQAFAACPPSRRHVETD